MIRAWWDIEVKDGNREVLRRGRHEARSFVANFARVFAGLFSATGGTQTTATVLNQAGDTASVYTESSRHEYGEGGTPMACNAGDDVDAFGIIPGSGIADVTIDDYAPDGKIAHGTGAGQLDYGPTNMTDLLIDTSISPPVAKFQIIRNFTNLSGGGVDINNVALVARSYWKNINGSFQNLKYLIARDKLPVTYTVPDGGVATITFTVEVVLG